MVGDAFRLCHTELYEIACLSVPKHFKNDSYTVNVEPFIKKGDRDIRYLQWRINPKTNQLLNFQTGMCLTSFDSKHFQIL